MCSWHIDLWLTQSLHVPPLSHAGSFGSAISSQYELRWVYVSWLSPVGPIKSHAAHVEHGVNWQVSPPYPTSQSQWKLPSFMEQILKKRPVKEERTENQQEHPYLSFSQGLLVHSSFSQVFPEYPVGHAQSKSGSPVNAFIFLEQTPFVVFDNSWVINNESLS